MCRSLSYVWHTGTLTHAKTWLSLLNKNWTGLTFEREWKNVGESLVVPGFPCMSREALSVIERSLPLVKFFASNFVSISLFSACSLRRRRGVDRNVCGITPRLMSIRKTIQLRKKGDMSFGELCYGAAWAGQRTGVGFGVKAFSRLKWNKARTTSPMEWLPVLSFFRGRRFPANG